MPNERKSSKVEKIVQSSLETKIERWSCAPECDWVRYTVTYACVYDAYVGTWGRGPGHEGQGGEGTKAVWTRRDEEETLKGATGAATKEGRAQGAGKKGRGDEGRSIR